MSLVLGVDVGSQSIKVVLVDEGGDVVATGSAALSMTHQHDGWAEQDPQTYCTALRDAVRAATAGIEPTRVVAMGLGSQVDGVVACDADGEPLRPAIIWLDKRATEQCDRLVAAAGEDTARRADGSGGRCLAQCTEDDVDPRPRTPGLAACGDARAGRVVSAAPPDRLVTPRTPRTRRPRWCTTSPAATSTNLLCAAAELDPSMFAPVRPSTEVVGTLLPDVASEFGLPASCAVVVGTGDEHAASVGAGAIEAGVVVDVTGTAEPVTTVSAAPVRDPLGLVETHGHAVPGSWLIENPGFVSGGSTLWLAGLLGVPQAEVVPAGVERAHRPAKACCSCRRCRGRRRRGGTTGCVAALLGLAMNHTPAHVARAVLEGCAFALRDIVDRLDALGLGRGEVRIVGGGARDNLWATIKASVLGRPVRRVLTEEATAVGAAMVAGVGAGVFADFTAASVAVRLAPAAIDPDPEATKTYADAYRRYLAAFDAVESALAASPVLSAQPTSNSARPT